MRAFVALALSKPIRARLTLVRETYVDADPTWAGEKWVAPENLHVTLDFLGDIDHEAPARLGDSLAMAVEHHPPFEARFSGVRRAGPPRRTRMLWAVLDDPNGALTALAAAVREADDSVVGARDQHPFAPHVTLVRARRPRPVDPVAIDAAAASLTSASAPEHTVSVSSITLFASTLGPSGPTYSKLSEVPLQLD